MNHLFLWAIYTMAMLQITRGYMYITIYTYICNSICIYNQLSYRTGASHCINKHQITSNKHIYIYKHHILVIYHCVYNRCLLVKQFNKHQITIVEATRNGPGPLSLQALLPPLPMLCFLRRYDRTAADLDPVAAAWGIRLALQFLG